MKTTPPRELNLLDNSTHSDQPRSAVRGSSHTVLLIALLAIVLSSFRPPAELPTIVYKVKNNMSVAYKVYVHYSTFGSPYNTYGPAAVGANLSLNVTLPSTATNILDVVIQCSTTGTSVTNSGCGVSCAPDDCHCSGALVCGAVTAYVRWEGCLTPTCNGKGCEISDTCACP